MRLDHDTPIRHILDLGFNAVDVDFDIDAAHRLKRSLIARGWHNTDNIPEKELVRLAYEATVQPRNEPAPVPDGTQDYSCMFGEGCSEPAINGNYCEYHGVA